MLLAALLVRGYLKYLEFRETPAKLLEAIPEGTNIVLGKVRHTAVREGKKEWTLEASSAQYSENTREAVFKDVKVTFYIDNGGRVYLEGEQGKINTASNDMQVSGSVRVENDDNTFLTETIEYAHKTRLITSQTPVRIVGRNFDLRANSMQVDLGSEKAIFAGDVEGHINDVNLLQM